MMLGPVPRVLVHSSSAFTSAFPSQPPQPFSPHLYSPSLTIPSLPILLHWMAHGCARFKGPHLGVTLSSRIGPFLGWCQPYLYPQTVFWLESCATFPMEMF
jgi:hypothetical protein